MTITLFYKKFAVINMPITFSDIAGKAFEYAGPIANIVRGKMEKNLTLYRALRDFGLGSNSNNDHDIFMKALIKYEDAGGHPDLVRAFSEKHLESYFMEAFKQTITLSELRKHVLAQLAAIEIINEFEENIDQDITLIISNIIQEAFNSLPPGIHLLHQSIEETKKEMQTVLQIGADSNRMLQDIHGQIIGGKDNSIIKSLPLSMGAEGRLTQNDFDERIDDTIDLLNKGSYKAAILSLEHIREKKASYLSPTQYYKIDVNIGLAAFEFRDYSKSAEFFTKLVNYLPDSAEAQGMTALGYALNGEYSKAVTHISLAKKIDRKNPHASVASLLCMEKEPSLEKYKEWEIDTDLSNPMIGLAAASFLIQYLPVAVEEALKILSRLNLKPESKGYFELLELKAVGTTWMINEVFKNNGGYIADDKKKQLIEAIDWFTIAWNFYDNNDLRRTKWHVLANRGAAYKMLGDDTNAERDLLTSISVNPHYFQYRHLLSLRKEQNKDNIELIKEAEKITKTAEEKEELLYMYLSELEVQQEHTKILEILEEKRKNGELKNNQAANFFEVRAMISLGYGSKAYYIAKANANEFPDNPLASYVAAQAALRNRDGNSARGHLQNALMHTNNNATDSLKLNIALMAYDLRMYREIEIFYDKSPYNEFLSEFSLILIKSLMANGKTEEALAITNKLIQQDPTDSILLSVIMDQHERNSDFKLALKIADQFPEDPYYVGKKIAYLFEVDFSKAMRELKELLKTSSADTNFSLRDKFVSLIVAAKTASMDALSFLQEEALIFRNGYSGAIEIHYGYQEFVTEVYNRGHFDPTLKEVTADTLVHLTNDAGEKKELIIGDSAAYFDSIKLGTAIANLLVGKQVNDTIVMDGIRWTIRVVGSQYYAAYGDSVLRVHDHEKSIVED